MGHQLVLVLLRELGDVQKQLEELLLPHSVFRPGNEARGHLDFWSIGGRWSGVLRSRSLAKLPLIQDTEALKGNVCRVSEIPDDLDFPAFVTPEGRWCFVWAYGDGHNDPSGVEDLSRALVVYKDCYVVAVDAHL